MQQLEEPAMICRKETDQSNSVIYQLRKLSNIFPGGFQALVMPKGQAASGPAGTGKGKRQR